MFNSEEGFEVALESSAQFDNFVKRTGVRRFSNLRNAKHFDMVGEQLPKRPTLHYLPDSIGNDNERGLEPKDPILFLFDKAGSDTESSVEPYVMNILEPTSKVGLIGNAKEALQMNKAYFSSYPQFNRVYNEKAAYGYLNPLVINYGLLDNLFPIRARSRMQWFDRTFDILTTFTQTVGKQYKESLRQQFFFLRPSSKLLDYAEFKLLMKNPTLARVRELTTPDEMYFFWFARWFCVDQKENGFNNMVNPFNHLDTETLNNLTLICYENKQFNVVTMQNLDDWRNEQKEEQKMMSLHQWMEGFVSLRNGLDSEVVNGEESEEFNEYQESIAELRNQTPTVVQSDFKAGVLNRVNEMADAGRISTKEYKYLLKQADKFEALPNPFTGDGKLTDLLEVDLKSIEKVPTGNLPDIPTITDKTYLKNSISTFDDTYVKERLDADIARSVVWLQKSGLPITNFKVEEVQDAANHSRKFTVQTTPPDGGAATFTFNMPVIDEEGTFMINGVKSRLDPQRSDLPIRKVAPDRVALTSAASKFFVYRSDKAIAAYDDAVRSAVGEMIVRENSPMSDVIVGKSFDNYLKLPKTYSLMSMRFRQFTFKGIRFVFDYHKRGEMLGLSEGELKKLEKNGAVVVGLKGKEPVIMDSSSYLTKIGAKEEDLGELEDFLGLARESLPTPFAETTIHGRKVPVIMVLGFLEGLEKTLDKLGIKYQVEERTSRRQAELDETLIVFKDSKVFIENSSPRNQLLIGGLVSYKTSLRQVGLSDLNTEGGFSQVMSQHRIGNGQIRKYQRYDEMWIDPITEMVLTRMKEPTEFRKLLVRATELLTTDYHPDENDSVYMVDKHYSRMVELLYKELFKGVEDYHNNRVRSKARMTINPKAVQVAITTDSAITQINEINPFMSAKERERVTYGGTGGRSSRTMTSKARQFHKSDIGKISEGGVDSGKVGTVFWTSANPGYDTLYGTMREFDLEKDGKASVVSPTALTMPFMTYND